MSSYLDFNGLTKYHTENKKYIDGKVPTLVAGDNINISTDEDTNKITISSTNTIVYDTNKPSESIDNMIWIG